MQQERKERERERRKKKNSENLIIRVILEQEISNNLDFRI